jgi:hypothetical protein
VQLGRAEALVLELESRCAQMDARSLEQAARSQRSLSTTAAQLRDLVDEKMRQVDEDRHRQQAMNTTFASNFDAQSLTNTALFARVEDPKRQPGYLGVEGNLCMELQQPVRPDAKFPRTSPVSATSPVNLALTPAITILCIGPNPPTPAACLTRGTPAFPARTRASIPHLTSPIPPIHPPERPSPRLLLLRELRR